MEQLNVLKLKDALFLQHFSCYYRSKWLLMKFFFYLEASANQTKRILWNTPLQDVFFFFLRKGHKTIAPTVQPPPPLNLFLWIELIVLSEVSVLPPLSHGSKNNNRQTQIFFFPLTTHSKHPHISTPFLSLLTCFAK